MAGATNIHLPLLRRTGERLLVRVRIDPTSDGGAQAFAEIAESEVATMRVLRDAGLPVPEVCSDIEHGVPTGSPISAPAASGTPLTHAQMRRLVHDVAAFHIRLSALAFDASGHLTSTGAIKPFSTDHPAQDTRQRWLLDARRFIELGKSVRDVLIAIEFEALLLDPAFEDEDPGRFYIVHDDDHGGQYLVDSDGRLTAILDWEQYAC
ncbi:hypothetical protein Q5752_000185 [Cryptotrichosporon argae]